MKIQKLNSSPTSQLLLFSLKDSSIGGHQERNWRGIITALLVIAIMCSLIALAVLVLSPRMFFFIFLEGEGEVFGKFIEIRE